MSKPIRSGLLLGVLVTVWQFLMGLTGWYKDPRLGMIFFLVVVFELVVLLQLLRQTAPESSYTGQLLNGAVMSLVAGVIIVCSSLVFTTVAYPNYFAEIEAAQAAALRSQGMAEPAIQAQLAAAAPMQTPAMNALSGFIGTVVTALVVSAVAGVFLRKKAGGAARETGAGK